MIWMCKKQSSVSFCSTESEVISLEAGLRMDGLLALDFWDVVMEVLRLINSTNTHKPSVGQPMRDSKPFAKHTQIQTKGKPRC